MSWFRVSYLTVGSLAFAVVAGLLTYYLLVPRNKSRLTWLLAGYVGFATLMAVSYIFSYSVLSPVGAEYYWAAEAIIFGVAFLLFFGYRFPRNLHPRASRIVPSLYLLAAVIDYVIDTVYARSGFGFLPVSHRYSFSSNLPSTMLLALGIILTIVVLLRKTVMLSEY
jgi:hypothetical protein